MTNNQVIQIAISALEWVILKLKETPEDADHYREHLTEKIIALEILKQMIKS